MLMVYFGVAMIALGYFVLTFFGVSSADHEKGADFTISDTIASVAMIIGFAIVSVYGLIALGKWLWSLFYQSASTYAHVSIWQHCQQASAAAGIFFFLSMMTTLRAEAQHRKWRSRDPVKAGRIRGSLQSYAVVHYRAGLCMLAAAVCVAVAKTL